MPKMYRKNHSPFGRIPISPFGGIPISPFGGIPVAGVTYGIPYAGFPVVINRPYNNNYNNYNGDIDINIVKKQNGSMLTPADTNYLKTKIHMLQIIFNIILNNLCFKNSNNNNQLVNQIKNDIASNATVTNHLSDLCLSGSNAVVVATAAAVPASVTQAAKDVAAAALAAALPANHLINVLVASRAELLKIQKINGMFSPESVAAAAVYAAIKQTVINFVIAAAAPPITTNLLLQGYIDQTIILLDTNINIILNGVPFSPVLSIYIATLTAAVTPALPAEVANAIVEFTRVVNIGPAPPAAAAIIAAVTNTPMLAATIFLINTAANAAAARYATTPAIVRKNPANQCFEPVFDDFKLHGLISSMRNNNFLRKACIYNSSRTGIDPNRIKINFAGGAYDSGSNSSNNPNENFNFINLLNILKEKDQSPDKIAILCVQTNGKLKCSNMKKKESTTECEFCERWTRERNMFRSVLKDLLEASDFNNTFDLMSASAYLLPSAIMDQKQYEQFYTAIDAYKKAKKEKK